MTAENKITRSVQAVPPAYTAAKTIGIRTAAEISRSVRGFLDQWVEGSACAAIAPRPTEVFLDGAVEIVGIEVGPLPLEEDELGIGALPEQEVADALFAAGADQEIGIRHIGGQQKLREVLLVQLLRLQLAIERCLHRLLRGGDDLVATAVAEGDCQAGSLIGGGAAVRGGDELDDIGAEAVAVADDVQADAVLMELFDLAFQIV